MPRSRKIGVETRFLVPLREDRHLGQRRLHPTTRWQWLERQLRIRFGGFSVSGATMRGKYLDPDTGRPVEDESRQYAVALPQARVTELRRMLAEEVAPAFRQKCIYLVAGGEAELDDHAYL